MCNAVQVCTCQSQTFRGSLFWDTLYAAHLPIFTIFIRYNQAYDQLGISIHFAVVTRVKFNGGLGWTPLRNRGPHFKR